MPFRTSFAIAAALLASTAVAPSAFAAGVQDNQAVTSSINRLEATTPLVAPPAACPGQNSLDAPAEEQERSMLCMIDFARGQAGLPGLEEAPSLSASADLKSRDILDCDDFSHFACERPFSHWIREVGYLAVDCWRVGENIAWGRGELGTVRSIFLAWMRSPTHRHNILSDYAQTGVSTRAGGMDPFGGVRVWTQHFGTVECDTPTPTA